jgi:hypothetical protein
MGHAVQGGGQSVSERFGWLSTPPQRVSDELRLLGDVADRSPLLMDPDAGGRYVIASVIDSLPKLSEKLGQMRALGALHLKRGAIKPAERATLQSTLRPIDQGAADIDRHVRKVAEG